MTPEPFVVRVEDDALEDLTRRLGRTRWPDQIDDAGWDYGTDRTYLQDLCGYWRDDFDWRAAERRLNQWPHFLTQIDGEQVHFIHARSPRPDAMPLLLTHGWPGSVVEFLDVIGPLSDPATHGGDASDAFHVICPSIPGYAWSGPTHHAGWHIRRVADALDTLMLDLGYGRYAAQGGDWGGLATAQLGARHADHLVGIHLNYAPVRPPGQPDDFEDMSAEELAAREDYKRFQLAETGYSAIQGTKPQTLAYGLADSPAGLAGWIVEKFRTWSDCRGDVESAFARDALLTNIATYWLTGTAGSSARLYYETRRAGAFGFPDRRVAVPTGVAIFPKELFRPRRRWVEHGYDLRHWSVMPRGGHFAAMEQPDLFLADVRSFFRQLR